jgi:hypothetical protein
MLRDSHTTPMKTMTFLEPGIFGLGPDKPGRNATTRP